MGRIRDYWRAVKKRNKAQAVVAKAMDGCFKVGDIVCYKRGRMTSPATGEILFVDSWTERLKVRNTKRGSEYWIDTSWLTSKPGYWELHEREA